MAATLTRRAFLLGREAGPSRDRATARVGPACLARRGVVCQNCRDACETGAIGFLRGLSGVARPAIDPAKCTGCGECAPACPVAAIVLEAPSP